MALSSDLRAGMKQGSRKEQYDLEDALEALHGDLVDWVHRNDAAAKKKLFKTYGQLTSGQIVALQRASDAAFRKHHGEKAVMYRRMKRGQSVESVGGRSLTTVKPKTGKVAAFEVYSSDVLLHWGVEDTPLNSRAFGHEREVILHADARPKYLG